MIRYSPNKPDITDKRKIMRRINYFSLIAFFIIFCNVPVSAQLSIKKILDYYKKVYPLPYPYPQPEKIPVKFSVDNSQVKIPNRVYKNIQCTEYDFAFDNPHPHGARSYAKFQLPQQEGSLLAIHLGHRFSRTHILVSVDSDGNVLDTLEVAVMGKVCIKEYRILTDGQIIVTTIKPKQEESIPLDFAPFEPFVGNRIDCTYIVENGKFVLKKEQRYADRTYTYELLSDGDSKLWDGNEQLLDQ